jgi:hypothetical protein
MCGLSEKGCYLCWCTKNLLVGEYKKVVEEVKCLKADYSWNSEA